MLALAHKATDPLQDTNEAGARAPDPSSRYNSIPSPHLLRTYAPSQITGIKRVLRRHSDRQLTSLDAHAAAARRCSISRIPVAPLPPPPRQMPLARSLVASRLGREFNLGLRGRNRFRRSCELRLALPLRGLTPLRGYRRRTCARARGLKVACYIHAAAVLATDRLNSQKARRKPHWRFDRSRVHSIRI